MFVKICGTTSEEDALSSIAMGADAVGFVMAPSSRQVTPETVNDIVKRLPPEILTVGVFRNETAKRVVNLALKTGVRAVQLHGNETMDDIAYIRTKLPLVIIKAVDAASPEAAKADMYGADLVLIDAPSPGSGQAFDWQLAKNVPQDLKVILAGGLNSTNIESAIEAVKPWGVDVVSGVESSPGIKDIRKLRDFIERAKAAGRKYNDSDSAAPFDWSAE